MRVTACASDGPALVTVIVYVSPVPAMTGSGRNGLQVGDVGVGGDGVRIGRGVIRRVGVGHSARDRTVLTCGLSVVEAGTVYATVTVALPPAAMVPRSQVNGSPAVQVPWLGVTAPWLKPDGKVSTRRDAPWRRTDRRW